MRDNYISNSKWRSAMKPAYKQGLTFPVNLSEFYVEQFCRYFRGVQGDSSRQGELFGLRNIFKLHEDTYATKMVVRGFVEFVGQSVTEWNALRSKKPISKNLIGL